ncbi:NAD-dependent protein deacylase [Slackia heliotrinireducens]|jgi:NAD-dependent deacetylase|uniref:NAD-dependent protein deacylase n=1 Tax=Slackia heliotrinireducens TaxID=84110 RepID=UPI003314C658
MTTDIETLRTWIDDCKPGGMVFFGGAGVSTESGIPDFRSPNGLYAQKYPIPPEDMVSHSYFVQHTASFFEFYCDRMIAPDAEPNPAHLKLAELEARGTLSAVITQNIDGLHQKAGSKNVLELHGSTLRNFCEDCHEPYSLDEMLAHRAASSNGVPHCKKCGGIIKPDVVLYEEPLDNDIMMRSLMAIASADLLVIAGTSLAVYPAAGLIDYFKGSHLAIVNMSPTPRDKQADLCISAPVGQVFSW